MSTRKKIPADVAALKSIVQEQSVKIAELEKSLKDRTQSLEYSQSNYNTQAREKDAALAQIEEVHILVDACAGALPRFAVIPAKNSWGEDQKRENSIMLRLASFMGAKG